MNSTPATSTGEPTRVPRKSLIVEGWRFLPHSYAIVNQWQLLALRRRGVDIKVIDTPFYRASWRAQTGLFDPASEQELRSLETARPGEIADVTLRVSFPFTFYPSRSVRTAVFATLEQQLIQRNQLSSSQEYKDLRQRPPPPNVIAITPSQWSAQGFYRAGFDPAQVLVVPHGVDPAMFRTMPEIRADMRRSLPISDRDFVFLSVGAMSGNKGIDLLLHGFAKICKRFPHTHLVLKGIDSLYNSKNFLLRAIRTLPASEQNSVFEKMTYIGDPLSHPAMATLYQVADAYVSPYRAEGFNIPVLEAAACGIPIICTRGGPTDDFVTDDFARRVDSTLASLVSDGETAFRLEPDLPDLITQMAYAIEDSRWRKAAAQAGPEHVGARYTWDVAADALIANLLT